MNNNPEKELGGSIRLTKIISQDLPIKYEISFEWGGEDYNDSFILPNLDKLHLLIGVYYAELLILATRAKEPEVVECEDYKFHDWCLERCYGPIYKPSPIELEVNDVIKMRLTKQCPRCGGNLTPTTLITIVMIGKRLSSFVINIYNWLTRNFLVR